jgi:xylitol oxidase
MDKRQFLKASGAILTSSFLDRVAQAQGPTPLTTAPRTNWAGNFTYSAARLDEPATDVDVENLINANAPVKALGARHSFNNIADTTGHQISLNHLDSMTIHPEAKTVTVGAGVTYGKLAPYIDSHGFAVHNLASLPHISVVGACATGTHGSGIHNGNLATSVRAMELVKADGETVMLTKEKFGDSFAGAVVHLGALGVLTNITLDVEPTFLVAQTVYENLSFNVLEHHLDEVFGAGYSVSLFTDWQNHRATQVWIKRRVETSTTAHQDPEFFGATIAKEKMHPITGHAAESCTEQMGVPGPWFERLPHFKMNFTPSSGAEIQTEYFVPRDKAYQAILAVEQLRDQITPHLFVTELRTIAADELWTSMAYQRPSLAIHFTWKPETEAVHQLLPLIEAKLAPFEARPHWGKVFTVPGSTIRSRYPKMPEYLSLVAQYDPKQKFRNQYLQINLYS